VSYKGRKSRLPVRDGASDDAFSGRRWYHFNAGTIKWIKRRFNKRERQAAKKQIRGEEG